MNHKMPTDDVIRSAVALASRAPSLHNSQPWRWVKEHDSLNLFGDPDRVLPSTDAFGRQMIISCGVALNHLQAAFAAAGWDTNVERLPDPSHRLHLAKISFQPSVNISEPEVERADAIARRRTDRLPFAAPSSWATFEDVLRNVIRDNGSDFDVLPDDCRPQLAKASEFTASMRRYDSMYQAELQWWSGHSGLDEGVPSESLVSSAEARRVGVGRRFPTVDTEQRRVEIDTDHAKLLVLTTRNDGQLQLLRCGEALSAVLLECTIEGLATCPLTHLTEIPESREIVRKLLGVTDIPQVIVRVGIAPKPADDQILTSRRPLADVLEFRS